MAFLCDVGLLTDATQTKLSVNPWVIHHSTEFFGSDAKEYNPGRWIGPQAKAIEKYFMPVCWLFALLTETN